METFVLVSTEEYTPPNMKLVMVFNKNKHFIGEDKYNRKLKRWVIFRDSAKYWLKQIA